MQQQYMLQQQEWMRQQQEAQQAQLMAAQQEEWNRQQQMLLLQQQQQQQQYAAQQQPLFPQQTSFASNNPFAANFGSPAQSQSPPISVQNSTASALDSFNLPSTFAQHTPSPATSALQSPNSVSPAPAMQRPTRSDGEHAHLANLLANREDGLDTFGNIGQLRYVHTHRLSEKA